MQSLETPSPAGSDKETESYHPAGCGLFIATYLTAYVADAAGALIDQDHAGEDELIALARLQNGCVGRCKDPLVDVTAVVIGKQPVVIFQQLLARAGTMANRGKVIRRRGRRAAWRFKTPDSGGVKIAS